LEYIESVQDDQEPVERIEFRCQFIGITARVVVRRRGWWILRWWWRRWWRRGLVMAAARLDNV
jgi:hypothetical protein